MKIGGIEIVKITPEVQEVIDYIKSCDKETTSPEQFATRMLKFDFSDVLEAGKILDDAREGVSND